MTANQAEYSIQLMSRTLGVSRSGFYAYHSRPPSARQVADDALADRIAAVHKASKETYGAPRIHAELADEGVHVGRKRIERLMKAKGLRGVSRRRFVVTTERDPRAWPASDLVDRNFYADAPNVLWVADITYVPTWAGFLYLAVVLDAFSRARHCARTNGASMALHRLGYGQRPEGAACHRRDEHGYHTTQARRRHSS